MKRKFAKIISGLIAIALIFTLTSNIEAKGVRNTRKASKGIYEVNYDKERSYYSNGTLTLYYIIPEEAKEYDEVKFSYETSLIEGTVKGNIGIKNISRSDNSADEFNIFEGVAPGFSYKFRLIVKNESGVEFSYKKNSYDVTDLNMIGPSNIWGYKTYDGKVIDENMMAHLTSGCPAIYNGLFKHKDHIKLKAFEVATINRTLQERGYVGESPLTDYLLDYYNDVENGFNKDGINATKLEDLDKDAVNEIFNKRSNAHFTSSQNMSPQEYGKLTEEEKKTFKIEGVSSFGNYECMFYISEKNLAEFAYKYYNDSVLSIGLGEIEQSVDSTSVYKIERNVKDIKTKMDNEISTMLTDEQLTSNEGAIINGSAKIDGPNCKNEYQDYKSGFILSFGLIKQASLGEVTVDKALDLSGYKYNDSPSFIFKLTDVNGKEYFKVMSFKEGQTYQSIVFENIPLGSYTVEELDSIRYEVIGESTDNGVLTSTNNSQIVFFKNKKEKNNDFSDTNVVVNSFQKTDNGIEISQDYMETQR